MVSGKIEPSPLDEDFRRCIKEALDSATREIIVISGELGAYEFPELKEAALRALTRNVKVRIYAVSPHPSVVNELLDAGAEVRLGREFTTDHYLVIDGKDVVISKKEGKRPTIVGERRGFYYTDDLNKAKRVANFFRELSIVETLEMKRKENVLLNFAYYIFRLFVPRFGKVKEPTFT